MEDINRRDVLGDCICPSLYLGLLLFPPPTTAAIVATSLAMTFIAAVAQGNVLQACREVYLRRGQRHGCLAAHGYMQTLQHVQRKRWIAPVMAVNV